jgi:hypothetical protein
MVGWYGLQSDGVGWMPVTPGDMANTLLLPTAVSLGATHVGYWSGRSWEQIQPVDRTEKST